MTPLMPKYFFQVWLPSSEVVSYRPPGEVFLHDPVQFVDMVLHVPEHPRETLIPRIRNR
jgi:hypothetical protein